MKVLYTIIIFLFYLSRSTSIVSKELEKKKEKERKLMKFVIICKHDSIINVKVIIKIGYSYRKKERLVF